MAPRKFGKYEVLARLATGGAANIFLARQPGAAGFQKLVCLKTLLPERVTDADFVAMFLDEARLAARLNHPNCVQIYDLGRVRGSYYISMEYLFGETLWNLLATVTKLRTPLPPSHVAAILANVCDGLHHAHELKDSNGRPYNLVHRDVSPQNIMITFEGQTKVVDFGIAKAETGRTPTVAGIVKGKFSYMSPEQITGIQIDRRSDVYSLGIVLFECLASRRLYRGDSPEEIARLILEHRAPRLKDVVPDIPPELDQVCATALSRHPSKRYQTAQAMGDALRDYLDSVRYAHSAAALGKLLDDRFKGQIPERRKVFESALNGSYDEAHLLKVLDARMVRDIDLFPEDDSAANDFVEPTSAPYLLSDPAGADAHLEEETGEIEPSQASSASREPPWRVDVKEVSSPPPMAPPSDGPDGELEEWDDDQLNEETRIDDSEGPPRPSDKPFPAETGEQEVGLDSETESKKDDRAAPERPASLELGAEKASDQGTGEIDAPARDRRDPVTNIELAPEGSQSVTAPRNQQSETSSPPPDLPRRQQKISLVRRGSAIVVQGLAARAAPGEIEAPDTSDGVSPSSASPWGPDTGPQDFGDETNVELQEPPAIGDSRAPSFAGPGSGPFEMPLSEPGSSSPTRSEEEDFDRTMEQMVVEELMKSPAGGPAGDATSPDLLAVGGINVPRPKNGLEGNLTVPLDKPSLQAVMKEAIQAQDVALRNFVQAPAAIEREPSPPPPIPPPSSSQLPGRKDTLVDARFGTPAIIAAFAVGLGLGIILGLLLAQVFSSRSQPSVIAPVQRTGSPPQGLTPKQTESK